MLETTNANCIPANAILLGLRCTGTWMGVQKTEMQLFKVKSTGKIKIRLIHSSWYQAAADVRILERTRSYVASGSEVHYIGMDDFGTALYSVRKPQSN